MRLGDLYFFLLDCVGASRLFEVLVAYVCLILQARIVRRDLASPTSFCLTRIFYKVFENLDRGV